MNRIVLQIISLICVGGISVSSSAQSWVNQQKQWVFGNGAGIDFSGTAPVAVGHDIFTSNVVSSIADKNGSLLFFTEGSVVCDRNGDTMTNGRLFGPADAIVGRPGGLITSVPGSEDKYYVFSVNDDGTSHLLYATLVDMSLNGGLGDVAGRPVLLSSDIITNQLTKMTAVQGDSCNIWLLVQGNDNNMYSFNITDTGISPVPVISSVSVYSIGSNMMKMSPGRNKIAVTGWHTQGGQGPQLVNSHIRIADFDPATGVISNLEILVQGMVKPLPSGTFLGVEFSPDGSRLYARIWETLYQWDMSQPTLADISASRTSVLEMTSSANSDLQLGPDGKIYFTGTDDPVKIHVINEPNELGIACDPVLNAITLLPGTSASPSVPTLTYAPVIMRPLPQDTVFNGVTDTLVCAGEGSWSLQAPAGFENYQWSNNDTGRTGTITAGGVYRVVYSDQCSFYADSFVVDMHVLDPQIDVNGYTLFTTGSFSSYQWIKDGAVIPGATEATYTVDENNSYQVAVTNAFGCKDTSRAYRVNNVSVEGYPAAGADPVRLFPNPAGEVVHIRSRVPVHMVLTGMDGRLVLKQDDAVTVSVRDLAPGVYLVRFTDAHGRLLQTEKLTVAGR